MFARASVAPSFTSGLSLLSRLINGGIPSGIKRNRYCHSGNSYIISHFYIHFPGIYTKINTDYFSLRAKCRLRRGVGG